MELFKLLGTIAIDNSEANKALKDTSSAAKQTANDVDDAADSGDKASSKWGSAFKKIGSGALAVGKTVATGLATATAALGALTVKALSSAGELEQNMGGSEAVFKQYASSIQETAKTAFSNMGLSTSDYLATANKMGALFQGAGFDIKESMTLSQDAMQRAADVASIMGIDTASAMEAVAGAAKGNFTMMDNLGVAMNETTLEAYALEKGMSKAYGEMSQQEKIGLAMEMFLDKTAYAAGNYAKENETLAGSLGTAKAALSNFISGSGTVEDVVSSFSSAANVIVKNIDALFPKLMTGITKLVQQIVPMIPPLLQKLLPPLIEGATGLINGIVAAMPQIIQALLAAVPALIQGVTQIINALIQALPSIIEALVSALPTLLPALINGLVSIIVTLCTMLPQIIQPIIDYLPAIIISIVDALMQNLPALIVGLISLVMGIVSALPQIIQTLVDALPQIISMVVTELLKNLPTLIGGCILLVMGLVAALPQIFAALIQAVPAVFEGIWNGIKNVFAPVGNWFGKRFSEAKENAAKAWSNTEEVFGKIWTGIKNVFSNVGNWFKDRFNEGKENAKKAWSNAKSIFNSVWTGIKNVFSNVGGWFKDQFNKAKENAAKAWSNAKETFSKIKNNVTDAFSDLGSKLKEKFSNAKKQAEAAWANVKSTWKNISNKVAEGFSGLGDQLKSKFSDALQRAKAGFSKAINIGKDLVSGLWQGITDKFNWLVSKIKGFAKNVTDKLKGFFGIKSPSRVFRDEIGKQLAEGVAVGLRENSDVAEDAAEEMGKKVLEAAEKRLDEQKTYQSLTLADEVAFWGEIKRYCEKGTDARLKADKKYFEAKAALQTGIISAEETLQNSLDDISERVNDRASAIARTFGLFDEATSGEWVSSSTLVSNLNSQLSELTKYQTTMESLAKKIGGTALYKELESLGVGSLAEIEAINRMSDSTLEAYLDKYNQIADISHELASKELEEETFAATEEAYQAFADSCAELGIDIVDDMKTMEKGISDVFASIEETIISTFEAIESALDLLNPLIDTTTYYAPTGFVDALTGAALEAGQGIIDGTVKPSDTAQDSEPSRDAAIMTMLPESTQSALGNAVFGVISDATKWHASAVKNPVIMKKPTIFGYDSATGKFQGGGEAGSEVVSGTSTLMNMIQGAVANQNGGLIYYFQKLIEILADYFPQLLEKMDMPRPAVFDPDQAAAALAVPMNNALGRLSNRKDRGR